MKILLTGAPHSGKTTLLRTLVDSLPVGVKHGFITKELASGGQRIGFEMVSSVGTRTILASVDSPSPIRVSRYGVDVSALDDFLRDLPPIPEKTLVYIDEIGQMQLFSDTFKQLVRHYLTDAELYIGTITQVYSDDFTRELLQREDIILLHVTENNRTAMGQALAALVKNMPLLRALDPGVRRKITAMAQKYAQKQQMTQLYKLFNNAVTYIATEKVSRRDESSFAVRGNHDDHQVRVSTDGKFICDCDLFNGRGQFAQQAGECSHIQAVLLYG